MHWLSDHKTQLGIGLLVGLSLGANAFLWLNKTALEAEKTDLITERNTLTQTLASTTAAHSAATDTITLLTSEIADLEEDKDDLRDDLRDEKDRNEDFEDQIKEIAGTVGVLDKLSKTDEELLQKYSKVYFLNENYIPEKLREIDEDFVQDDREPEFFHGDALSFLEDMLNEAEDDDIDITVISAYRSFDEQNAIKGTFTQIYGEGANAFSADQGFSEHQLGTTVDFGTSELRSALSAFANTEAYEWLLKHAHKYGFTLSYPEDNQFYIYEPWHWRFVGRDLAKDLYRDDAHFYDWDQRDIDEYLVKIFD